MKVEVGDIIHIRGRVQSVGDKIGVNLIDSDRTWDFIDDGSIVKVEKYNFKVGDVVSSRHNSGDEHYIIMAFNESHTKVCLVNVWDNLFIRDIDDIVRV